MSESADHSAVLDGLQLVVAGERDAVGSLTQIPPDLFTRAEGEIATIRKIFAVCTDPTTPPVRTATERIEALQQHLEDLVRMRSQKVLLLALSRAEGRAIDREDLKRMLPMEQDLFGDVLGALERYRQVVLGRMIPFGEAGDSLDMAVCDDLFAGDHTGVHHTPLSLARVLSPVEPFLGFDGRTYSLEVEDIATLPPENAAVLSERNIILSIFPDK
jgi:DNA replication factor GINS